jgi:O-methyltransferase
MQPFPLLDRPQPLAEPEVHKAYETLATQPGWRHPDAKLAHHLLLPGATRAPWLDDIGFLTLFNQITGHTLVDLYRTWELWTLAQQLRHMPGDILEVGVWRGGTGAVLATAAKAVAPDRVVYLADTFQGVVKASAQDTQYKGGEHADTSEAEVAALMQRLGLANTVLLKGIFPEDTGHRVRGPLALVHIDVDVYESARDIVQWALLRLVPGAILVFDDYGFYGCEGIARFCDEFRAQPGFRFMHNLNGHAVFIRV